MEIYKVHLIKVAILYLGIAIASIFFAYEFFKLMKKFNNKYAKIYLLLLTGLFIIGSVILPFNILPDLINYNPQVVVGEVKNITATYQSSSIKERVYLDDSNSYLVYFYNVNMRTGRKYKIIYTPRSKIILDAIEISY